MDRGRLLELKCVCDNHVSLTSAAKQVAEKAPNAVISSPGRGRDKLREESLLNYGQQKEGFLAASLLGMTDRENFFADCEAAPYKKSRDPQQRFMRQVFGGT
jgi:hypothetical protein